MFVEDVQLVEGVEGIIPSLVWFYAHNKIVNCRRGLCYLSLFEASYKLIPGFIEREFDVLRRSGPKLISDNLADSQIQGCMEIVNGVPDDESQPFWGGFIILSLGVLFPVSGCFSTLSV